jgi:hypothetical protein
MLGIWKLGIPAKDDIIGLILKVGLAKGLKGFDAMGRWLEIGTVFNGGTSKGPMEFIIGEGIGFARGFNGTPTGNEVIGGVVIGFPIGGVKFGHGPEPAPRPFLIEFGLCTLFS